MRMMRRGCGCGCLGNLFMLLLAGVLLAVVLHVFDVEFCAVPVGDWVCAALAGLTGGS